MSTTRSNVVPESCLTIRARSPLAPLKKGGTRASSKSPDYPGGTGAWSKSPHYPGGGQERGQSPPTIRGGQDSSQSPPTIRGMRGGSGLGYKQEIQRFLDDYWHQWEKGRGSRERNFSFLLDNSDFVPFISPCFSQQESGIRKKSFVKPLTNDILFRPFSLSLPFQIHSRREILSPGVVFFYLNLGINYKKLASSI